MQLMCMEAKIICKSVRDLTDPILEQVEKTYTESFPEAERRDFALVRNLLAQEPKFFLQAILKDEQYVGFITCWKFEGYTYAEHFAIDPAQRNGGYGKRAQYAMRQLINGTADAQQVIEDCAEWRDALAEIEKHKED